MDTIIEKFRVCGFDYSNPNNYLEYQKQFSYGYSPKDEKNIEIKIIETQNTESICQTGVESEKK